MDIQLDIWLRGDNHATTEVITPVDREPRSWTEGFGVSRASPSQQERW